MGDFDAARPILEEAVALYEKSLGPQHPFVGQALNNLAELLRAAGEPDEARECYQRSLEILEQAYGPEHPEVGVTLDNLADLHEAGGDDTEAEALYARAIAIREEALGPQHPDVAESLLSLGLLLAKSGQSAEALGLLERALSIREESLGPAHPQVSEALAGLAAVVAAIGDAGRALELALHAERVGRDHLRLTGRSLAEQLALRYAAVRNRGLDLALSIAAGGGKLDGGREVLDSLVRSRAVVLDEMAARQRSVVGSGNPEIARLAEELAEARATLANLTVRGVGNMSPETYRSLLDETRRAKQAAESRLAAASVEFAREQQRSRLGLEEVAASLPPSSALVSIVVFDRTELAAAQNPQAEASEQAPTVRVDPARTVRYYLALVLQEGGGDPVAVPLGTAEEIEPLVRRWKREVASPDLGSSAEEAEASYRRVAESLRLKIWDPLEARLAGAERVFVVPDGLLNMVSFASLPVDEGKYLIESGKLLHYLSAERDLVSTSSRDTTGQGLLALGGPDYDDRARVSKLDSPLRESAPGGTVVTTSRGTRASCGSFDSLRFEPLPEAAVEAEEIASLWRSASDAGAARGGVLHLAGSAASEAAFKKGAPRKQVLHLATHGFFLGGDCGSARDRTRSRGFKVTQEESVVTGLSPLLLSGLALAGANQRAAAAAGEEDGVITAEEIASLDLSGVDWAVLSACDTGVGEIQAGEGVFGLRRAMQIAGVRTLIMSLWPVDDEATRAWMKTLYGARLSGGLDTPRAVREAGRAVMLQRREAGESTHPFFWAAFVAAGEWR
jgi:CHAT domain-containing protein